MRNLRNTLGRLLRDETGSEALDYACFTGLLIVLTLISVKATGGRFEYIGHEIDDFLNVR